MLETETTVSPSREQAEQMALPWFATPLPRRLQRTLRLELGLAALFLVMGIGNLWFGIVKHDQYSHLLEQAASQFEQTPATRHLALPLERLEGPRVNKQLEHIRSRLDFYRFVMMGAKFFLATAGFILLVALVSFGPIRARPGSSI